jgi:putative DNA primase/helicase
MTAFLTTDDILRDADIKTNSTAPGPFYTTCPRCSPTRKKRNDRCLAGTIYPDGGAGWRCFHCDWSGGASLRSSRRINGNSVRSRVRVPITAQRNSEVRNRHRALAIWNEARNPRGTIVEHYLTAVRGLRLPHEIAGDVIRFHPTLFFEGARVPGMVALFRDIATDEPCGIHRVFLDSEGRKLKRMMLGRARGAAIKLDADENVTLGLTIGEGIETCIAARLAGFRPVWALGSADAIGGFPVLSGIEAITMLGETDDGGKNYENTQACVERWIGAGREAIAVVPVAGDDLNEVWREVNHGE